MSYLGSLPFVTSCDARGGCLDTEMGLGNKVEGSHEVLKVWGAGKCLSCLMEVLYTVHGLWHLEDNLYKKWPVYAFLMRLEGSSIFYLEIKQDLHEGGKDMKKIITVSSCKIQKFARMHHNP